MGGGRGGEGSGGGGGVGGEGWGGKMTFRARREKAKLLCRLQKQVSVSSSEEKARILHLAPARQLAGGMFAALHGRGARVISSLRLALSVRNCSKYWGGVGENGAPLEVAFEGGI